MMDKSDNMVTKERTRNNVIKKAKANQSQRTPMCTRCQNHGIKVAVKFHKRECQHRFCICEKCIFTSQRQHFMKVATAQRRARQQYEEKMQMQEAQKKKAMSESSHSDSNSSDTPPMSASLNNNSNHSSNSDLSKSASSEPAIKAWRKVMLPGVFPPIPPTLPAHTSPLSMMFSQAESDFEQVEVLLGYSAKLLERFGYPAESIGLMYVILKDARADVEAASRRITIANTEIQASSQYKLMRFGSYYPGSPSTGLGTLGSPTYIGSAPYVGLGPPPMSAGLDLIPGSLTSQIIQNLDKVGLSPDSPPERPSSYPDMSVRHHFKLEKSEVADYPKDAHDRRYRVARAS